MFAVAGEIVTYVFRIRIRRLKYNVLFSNFEERVSVPV
jgi:hypothetical protein